MNNKKGFTLIEILVVIGLIAILAGIVLIAINPARQFALARNSQRISNVNSILNAIGQHIADNKGIFAGGTPACPAMAAGFASTSIMNGIGAVPNTVTGFTPAGAGGAGVDLSCLSPAYMPSFPTDPNVGAGVYTGYEVSVNSIGRVMVCAPGAGVATESAILGSAAYCLTR